MMREAAAILGARWDKVPERQRPHYGPEQRFRILRIRSFFGLSQRETACDVSGVDGDDRKVGDGSDGC
jgi:hypothetical protein